MTQHPFDREFSEEEAAKLNAEQKQTDSGDELNEDELEEVAGGVIPITDGINEGGGFPTFGINEGGVSKAAWENGNGLHTK
jgi:hypothetical protein